MPTDFSSYRTHGHQLRPWLLQGHGATHGSCQQPYLDNAIALGGRTGNSDWNGHSGCIALRYQHGLRWQPRPLALGVADYIIFRQSFSLDLEHYD